MAEKLTNQTQVAAGNLSRDFLMWIAKMDEAVGSRDRTVSLLSLEEFIGQGSLQVSQTGHGFSVMDVLRHNGTDYVAATADTAANARSAALVVDVPDVDTLVLRSAGYVTGLSGLTAGNWYYLQDGGGLGTSAGTVEFPILLATAADQGWLAPLGFSVEDLGAVSAMDDLSDADTSTQSPTTGDALTWDGSNWTPLKHNLAASAAPTVNDDTGSDYEVGSLWADTTNDKAYVCLDASSGAAVWTEVTQTLGTVALNDLSDVDAASPSDGQVLTWVDANSAWEPTAASGVSDFTSLDDTPGSYSGEGGNHVAVNSGETALEFVDPGVVDINTQTGTTYTLVLSDTGKMVTLENASAITLTVPPNSSVAFPTGTSIALSQLGAGTVTVSPGSGVTINSESSNTSLSGQYATAALLKTGTDEWLLTGSLA